MIKKLPWPEIIVTALVIAAGAGVYLYAHRDEDDLRVSKERGAVIVQALDEYRAAHGTWPDSLPQLVPAYATTIPQPAWGLRRWRYRTYSAEGSAGEMLFQLSVAADESGYPVLYYDPVTARWVLNH